MKSKNKLLDPKVLELKLKTKPFHSSRLAKEVDLKIKATKNEKGEDVIEGYLAVFGVIDMSREIFVKGAFAKSIKEHGPESKSKYKIKMFWQHKQDDPIGQFLELKEDDYGLYFKAKLDAVPSGTRTLLQTKSGTLNQYSVGFLPVWDKVKYDEKQDAYYLYEVELFEGSPVSIPDNMETYTIKNSKQFNIAVEALSEETEKFISTIPRSKRMLLRELITKHISLSKAEPLISSKRSKLKKKALKLKKAEPKREQGFNISTILKTIKNGNIKES